MGLLSNKPEARPYTVVVQDKGGARTEYHVIAYDAIEAMMAANTKATAAGMVDPKMADIYPDEQALAERERVGGAALAFMLGALGKRDKAEDEGDTPKRETDEDKS